MPASPTTWNPSDKQANVTLSNGNMTAYSTGVGSHYSVRATNPKWWGGLYAECTVDSVYNNGIGIGILLAADTLNGQVGATAGGWAYLPSGSLYHGGSLGASLATYTLGDVIGIAKLGTKLWFRKNGTWQGTGANPETGANPAYTNLPAEGSITFYLAGSVLGHSSGDLNQITLNAGATSFHDALPSGFVAWNDATGDAPFLTSKLALASTLPAPPMGMSLTSRLALKSNLVIMGGSVQATSRLALNSTVSPPMLKPLSVTARLALKATPTPRQGVTALSRLALKSTLSAHLAAVMTATSRLGLRSTPYTSIPVTVTSRLALASSMTGVFKQYATVVSRLGLGARLGGVSHLSATATSRLGLSARLLGSWSITVTSRLGLASASTGTLHAVITVTSKAAFASTITAVLRQYAQVTAKAGLGSRLTGTAHLLASVTSRLGLVSFIEIVDEAGRAEVWVVNTRTGGVSRYAGLPGTQMAWIGGRLLMAGKTGLYELTGNDDQGSPIQASYRTGKMDFGTPLLKRVKSVDLLYESTGQIAVRPINAQGGRESSFVYTLPPQTAGEPRDGVVHFSAGAKSVYWSFETSNVAGAAFKVSETHFYPIVLQRRRG